MGMPVKHYAFLFLAAVFPITSATAQSIDGLIAKYQRAVVKLTVTGIGADGQRKRPMSGSGFVIQSGARNSLILTAAHVIGSSDWRQMLNPDWEVGPDGRTLNRGIKVEILDAHGTLTELGEDASVIDQNDQKDVAVLLIDRIGLQAIPFAANVSDVQGSLQSSLLLGFPKDEHDLAFVQGAGSFRTSPQRGLTFRLNFRVAEGLSGGPVIDTSTGKAIAIVSANVGAGNEHHAVSLFPILPAIGPYLQYADKLQPSAAAAPRTEEGNSVSVSGDSNITFGGRIVGSKIEIDRGGAGRQ